MRFMRVPHVLLLATALGNLVPGPAQAGADGPVLVTVTGQTAIRLRLARGRTSPCDSTENRMLFEGLLAPGRYVFEPASDMVCYQFTSAEFPESGWSGSRVAPTRMRQGPLTLTIP